MNSTLSYLLFDLDNTLYPASSELHSEISRRMHLELSKLLGPQNAETEKQRREGFERHGTTARWLQMDKGISAQQISEFLEAVHPPDTGRYLDPAPQLDALLQSIELPKAVLTNSTISHATRVLTALGIREHFTHIFDITSNGLEGKPAAGAYTRALDQIGAKPGQVLFLDDVLSYLDGFRRLGGHTLFVDETGSADSQGHRRITSVLELPSILQEYSV